MRIEDVNPALTCAPFMYGAYSLYADRFNESRLAYGKAREEYRAEIASYMDRLRNHATKEAITAVCLVLGITPPRGTRIAPMLEMIRAKLMEGILAANSLDV